MGNEVTSPRVVGDGGVGVGGWGGGGGGGAGSPAEHRPLCAREARQRAGGKVKR